MLRLIICIMLLGITAMLSSLSVEATQDLLCYDNLDFTGKGSVCQDMSTLLAWRQTIDLNRHIRIMRFSVAGLPLWQEPLSLPCDTAYYITSSSDAFFVAMLSYTTLKVYKFSLTGSAIWPAEGIDLQPGTSLIPYELTLHPDASGGLWLASNTQSHVFLRHYATIQRLDANGNPVFDVGGIVFGSDDDCYLRDSILLADNSIMFSLSFRETNTLIRIAESGDELFRDNFPSTLYALEYSSLAALSETRIMYAVGRRDFADVYVFSVDGATALQNSFLFACDVDAGQYINVTALSPNEAIISVRNFATRALMYKKVTQTGVVLYERTLSEYQPNAGINYALHPADNGECYIVYNEGECCIKAVKISSDGETLWERDIISPENYSNRRPDFFSARISDAIKLYWMDYRFSSSGIYHQGFNVSGTPFFSEGGEPLVTGTRGFIVDSDVLALEQSSIAVTLQKRDQETNATLHLAILDPQPDSSWPAEGLIISHEVTKENRVAQKTLKAGDKFLVLWIERDQTDHLKAQLISPHGQKMWGTEGINVYSGDITTFFGTTIDGSIFIAWQRSDGDIYCHKVLGGMLQGHSICLYDQNDNNPYMSLNSFIGGYIVLTSNDGLRVLRVLSDMRFDPAFGNDGLLVTSSSSSHVSSRCQEDNLILNISAYVSFPPLIFPIVVTPEAEILVSNQIHLNTGYIRPFLKSGYLYTARYDTVLEIAKYNLTFECLWTKQLAVSVPYEGFINGAIEALNDSSFVILFYVGGDGNTLHYYVFDAEGNSTMENYELLYSSPIGFNRKHSIAHDAIYLLYRDYQNNQWLKVQKIDVDSEPQATEYLSPSPPLIFRNPYPNPFKNSTTIQWYLKEPAFGRIALYNLKGQKVKELLADELSSGLGSIKWDGNDSNGVQCAQGIYFVRMEAKGKVFTAKLIKLK